MNGKQHFLLFTLVFIPFAVVMSTIYGLYFRVIAAIFLIPYLNPDVDLSMDMESHRFFFTHSLIPATLFWWCLLPAISGDFQYDILLVVWFYPLVHLIGDLKISTDKKAYGGTWRVKFLPYIRLRKDKSGKWELDLKYPSFSLLGSWLWYLGNIGLGLVGFSVILF
jgi:hypothetical protein